MYFLDTDVCIYLLERRSPAIEHRLRALPLAEIWITSITAGELRYGALHSSRPAENLARVEAFLQPLSQAAFGDQAARHFAEIKQSLTARGTPIGPFDMLIAATVLAVNGTLITNNIREFERVPGLRSQTWA